MSIRFDTDVIISFFDHKMTEKDVKKSDIDIKTRALNLSRARSDCLQLVTIARKDGSH